MLTIETLRGALTGDGEDRVLTLDPAFQGLPDTAHGGSVLALFDLVSATTGRRRLDGHYLKRVPLGVPLRLRAHGRELELSERDAVLVRGRVDAVETPVDGHPAVAPLSGGALELPISRTCFACGVDNPLGLRARLRADDVAVGGTWTAPPAFATAGGDVAPLALTTLLDEAAFWLGALATGEAGMTTELRVTLHRAVAAGSTITVYGDRAAVRPRADDPRYTETTVVARDKADGLVASAAITFVAVRGAARRLVTGMLAVNAPELLRRVFPSYTPAS